MKRGFIGKNAVNSAIIAVGIFAWIILIGGALFTFIAINNEGPIGTALIITSLCIPFFILKGVLRGFESIVIASEIYIAKHEQTESTKE